MYIYNILIANIKRIAVIMSKGIQVLRERYMGAKGLKSIAITIKTTFAQSIFFSNA